MHCRWNKPKIVFTCFPVSIKDLQQYPGTEPEQQLQCQISLPNIGTPAASYGSGGTLLFYYFKKQHEVETDIVFQETQTKESKDDSSANVVLKISLQEFTGNMLVIQISGWYILKRLAALKIIMYKNFWMPCLIQDSHTLP